ncbi:hypothetical protein M409DRAFT_57619 [Zasmidium cellare ATCC 36951]|uniref:FAD-binding domain-containing protein n=1 Tax=Zasmidium cellare ATCC 36951 TaxID=1080233 RepID=A0A6A6C826_ZASCE|nr:uncharacterized protein M409DRAFT_57619 [Zasmidium cellare ATCC 36951]KAF2163337.1 hypothetical protein M409DRAFT_57619 [Zasmidium cellare ATCC 36951]
MQEDQPLRVAIIGGGIAGACLMHALTKHKHLDAHIYEAAPTLKEAGYAVGVAKNAFQALSLIGPTAVDALTRAGAVKQNRNTWMLGEGPDAGQEIDSIDFGLGDRIVRVAQRADFLRELLKDVAPERMHVNKKLVRIEQHTGDEWPVTLTFADGSTKVANVVIGADGIHSYVRRYILGEDDPAAKPRLTPWYNLWTMLPYEQARATIGPDLIDKDDLGQYMWWGDGTYMMHTISDNGRKVQFLACAMDPTLEGATEVDRTKGVDKEAEKERFRNWPPNLYKAVVDFLDSTPSPKPLHLWEHPHAHTYIRGPLALTGDAAHGTTPWQGSGGGMAVEDAPILSALLGTTHTPREARLALQVYDEVRRPRTQAIVDSSRAVGMLSTGQDAGFGLSGEKLRGKVVGRWDFIAFWDCEGARDGAVRSLEGRLEGERMGG